MIPRARLDRAARSPLTWAGALFAFHAFWLWDALLGRATLFTRDLFFFVLPFKMEAGRIAREGHLPSLSWRLMSGIPLWAHPSAEIPDPTTLLFVLLENPYAAFAWATLIHGVTAGLGTFLLARALCVRPIFAGWCAFAYACTGPVLSMWTIKAVPTVALPWMALGGVLMGRNRPRHAWPVTALAVAYATIHPDPPAVASAVILALVLCVVTSRNNRRMIAIAELLGAGVVGAWIAGVSLFPAVHVVAVSVRTVVGKWNAASTLGWRWLELVGPAGFGALGTAGAASGGFKMLTLEPPFIGSLYVGATMLVGITAQAPWRRRKDAALAAYGLLLVVLAHGDSLPGSAAVWSAVHARFPEKLLLPAILCGALLAGRAFSRLRKDLSPSWIVLAIAGALAMGLGDVAANGLLAKATQHDRELLAAQMTLGGCVLLLASVLCMLLMRTNRAHLLPSVVITFMFFESMISARTTLFTMPASSIDAEKTVLAPESARDVAVFCCSLPNPGRFVPTMRGEEMDHWSGMEELVARMQPSTGILLGARHPVVADMGGFDSVAFRGALTWTVPSLTVEESVRLMSRWGVQRAITFEATPGAGQVLTQNRVRMWVGPELKGARRIEGHARWYITDNLDLAARALAAGETELALTSTEPLPAFEAGENPVVTMLREEDAYASARVQASVTSMVLHTAMLREGWTALVDGNPAELIQANVAHMAVKVPPGDHVVEFRYEIPALAGGAVSTLAGLALLALMTFRRR